MNYEITPKQLDKVLKPFFDKEFKDVKWGEYNDRYGGGKWYGFLNQDGVLLAGHPSHDDSILYTNGEHFINMWDIFSVTPKEFNYSIGRYLGNRYGKWFENIT